MLDDMTKHIMGAIAHLPLSQQAEIVAKIIATALPKLDIMAIRAMRDEVKVQYGDSPLGQDALDLIDGHLALREMGVIS